MREAVAEARADKRRKQVFAEIRRIARTIELMSDEEIQRARREGRP